VVCLVEPFGFAQDRLRETFLASPRCRIHRIRDSSFRSE